MNSYPPIYREGRLKQHVRRQYCIAPIKERYADEPTSKYYTIAAAMLVIATITVGVAFCYASGGYILMCGLWSLFTCVVLAKLALAYFGTLWEMSYRMAHPGQSAGCDEIAGLCDQLASGELDFDAAFIDELM